MTAAAKKKKLILKDKNLYKGLFILALPLMLSNLLKAVHDFIDTLFLGSVADSVTSQAAVAIVSPLIGGVLALFTGISIGVVSCVSRAVGQGDKAKAKKFAGSAVTVSILLSAAMWAVTYFACPLLLRLLSDGAAYESAVVYIRVRSFEIPAFALGEVFRGYRQAQGDTVAPVAVSAVSVVVNIALTWLLVHLGFGIFGAGLATMISQYAALPLCVIGLAKSKKYLTVPFKSLLPKDVLKPLLKVSAPAAVSGALAQIGFLVLQYFIRCYGNETIAAFSVCNRICNILIVPVSALGSILTAFIGQNLGNASDQRAWQSYRCSRNLTLVLMAALGMILFFLRGPVISLLSNDEGVRSAAGEYIIWCAATLPLIGMFQNYCGAYNGYGKTGFTFILESVRLWALRLPLVLLLGFFGLGRAGLWYAMAASNILVCILGHILLKRAKAKPK